MPEKPDDDSLKNSKMTRSAWWSNRVTVLPKSARRLGVNENNVNRWVRQYRDKYESASTDGQTREQLETELKRLRKENKRLEMEREILKKAAAFFANESK